ncbi:MAG: M15 family metallopeptidase [Bacteroidales bacterium]|nr:M15 family metallopeptidase [Bacteroidales bacterium]
MNNDKNIENMFDDLKSTYFEPEEFELYKIKITNSTINKISFLPIALRGFSKDFLIYAKIGTDYYKCTGQEPIIKIKPTKTDTISFVLISNLDGKKTEFVRNPENSFVVSVGKNKLRHAISRIDIYSDNELLNDSINIQKQTISETDTKLSETFIQKYNHQIFGNLTDKRVSVFNGNNKASWIIKSNGEASFFTDYKYYFHGKIIQENGKNIFKIDYTIGLKLNDTKIDIINKNLCLSDYKLYLPIDGENTDFLNLKYFPDLFLFDIRYATDNNFTKTILYDEPFCYLRYLPAQSLIQASKDFISKGYKIKIFDGYRPQSCQYKMWKVCPNPNFVANPDKGSIHNRGGAVDLTLTINNENIDMGTDFDYCGYLAYPTNMDISPEIIKNRMILKETMEKYGFRGIRTEWWHFGHVNSFQYNIEDIELKEFMLKE